MAERRRASRNPYAPLPEAERPGIAKPPRPGSRGDREQIAANLRDQRYINAETLRRRRIECDP